MENAYLGLSNSYTGIREKDSSAVRVQHSSPHLTTPETRPPLHLEQQEDIEVHPLAPAFPPNNGLRRRGKWCICFILYH